MLSFLSVLYSAYRARVLQPSDLGTLAGTCSTPPIDIAPVPRLYDTYEPVTARNYCGLFLIEFNAYLLRGMSRTTGVTGVLLKVITTTNPT